MGGISFDPSQSEISDGSYVAGSVTVGTTQIELKAGATRLDGREHIMIENNGSQPIYIGPSGVTSATGIKLSKDQFITMPIGGSIAIYAITSTSSSNVTVQEMM